MKTIICWLLVIVFSVAATSYAAQPDKRSERTKYQNELEKLKKENPKEYEKIKKGYVIAAELVLAALGYGIGPFSGTLDEKIRSALRTYEKKRNIPVTGDPLSFDTMQQLESDMKTIEYHPISLPFLHVSTDLWEDGYVSASGTWVLSNEKMGEPEQTSKINCYRSMNRCIEAVAVIGGEGSERRLFVDIEIYEIERWDAHEIVTKPLQTTFGCVRYLRRFNRLQKSVTGIRSTISDEGICKGVDTQEKHMVLTDGFKVFWDLLQEHNKKRGRLLNISPDLLQYLESDKKEKSK